MRPIAAGLALALGALPLPAGAQVAHGPIAAILAEAGPGTRWGIVIADNDGHEIVAIAPDGRFIPASNTKLFTTAAALWADARGEGPQLELSGTTVTLEDDGDVVLTGNGDARLSSLSDCVRDCLAALADAVARKTRRVRDITGDARLFPDQRWSPGMSWNNIPTSSGTAVAALVVDDNEITVQVAASGSAGTPVVTAPHYLSVRMERTSADSEESGPLAYERRPGSRELVVSGKLAPGQQAVSWQLGVDDPALYAAWQLSELLKARGVRVTGAIRSRYCTFVAEGSASHCKDKVASQDAPLATLTPGSLAEDIAIINKGSQNLHAELLLRRLGLSNGGDGSIAEGQKIVSAMLAEAGVGPHQVSLSDGSGMSTYNRVAPRGTVSLLRWIARQPWAESFRASLPVGGVDGTLQRRFVGTPLEGRIFAKTGALNATNALAGWLTGASGKRYAFAAYANDVPDKVRATVIMDRALVAFAAEN